MTEDRRYSMSARRTAYYVYGCKLLTGADAGRIIFTTRLEGARLVVGGKYAGRIAHKAYCDKTYAELMVRRDI